MDLDKDHRRGAKPGAEPGQRCLQGDRSGIGRGFFRLGETSCPSRYWKMTVPLLPASTCETEG